MTTKTEAVDAYDAAEAAAYNDAYDAVYDAAHAARAAAWIVFLRADVDFHTIDRAAFVKYKAATDRAKKMNTTETPIAPKRAAEK